MRPAARLPLALLAVALLATALAAGCGAGGNESGGATAGGGNGSAGALAADCAAHAEDAKELRASGVACPWARALMYRWGSRSDCAAAAGLARGACRIGAFRCSGTVSDGGVAVHCANRGRSIAFLSLRPAEPPPGS